MKNKSFGIIAAGLLISFCAHAEIKCPMDKKCEAQNAKAIDSQVEQMTKDLKLTADQQSKIKASLEKMWSEKCAVHQTASDQMQTASQNADSEIRAILSPEQQAQMDKMKKERVACCDKAGAKGHSCPTKKKATACCPMTGDKSKK